MASVFDYIFNIGGSDPFHCDESVWREFRGSNGRQWSNSKS